MRINQNKPATSALENNIVQSNRRAIITNTIASAVMNPDDPAPNGRLSSVSKARGPQLLTPNLNILKQNHPKLIMPEPHRAIRLYSNNTVMMKPIQ